MSDLLAYLPAVDVVAAVAGPAVSFGAAGGWAVAAFVVQRPGPVRGRLSFGPPVATLIGSPR